MWVGLPMGTKAVPFIVDWKVLFKAFMQSEAAPSEAAPATILVSDTLQLSWQGRAKARQFVAQKSSRNINRSPEVALVIHWTGLSTLVLCNISIKRLDGYNFLSQPLPQHANATAICQLSCISHVSFDKQYITYLVLKSRTNCKVEFNYVFPSLKAH